MSNYPVKFGKYLLLERVNVGGMAEVFKAKTFGVAGFERILAIKRILPNLVEDDEFVRMFIDEARIAVQLNHANIAQIYELGKHGEHYYIAMEYLPSRDLRANLDRLRSHGQIMPIPQAAFIAAKVCEGLDYAHRRKDGSGSPMNIIHRDVSPQNILIGYEGEVKVIDFGIAKAANRASKTQAGVLKGKFGYMSPEQVRGLPTDRRSDIFAVGVLLYEMLTGERLFIGESDFSTLERVRNAEVTPPTNFNKKISPELEAIVLKTLAREVEDRYQWASDLAEDLSSFMIEDKTVFNAKRLALVMKDSYAAEIALERQKLEEFLRVTIDDVRPDKIGATMTVLPLPMPQPEPQAGGRGFDHGGIDGSDDEDDQIDASAENDAEGFGEDKTFVIEASVAGMALQNQETDPGLPGKPTAASAASGSNSARAAQPRMSQLGTQSGQVQRGAPGTDDDHLMEASLYGDDSEDADDSRTLVSVANPLLDPPHDARAAADDGSDEGLANARTLGPSSPGQSELQAAAQAALQDAKRAAERSARVANNGSSRSAPAARGALSASPVTTPQSAFDPVAAAMAEEEAAAAGRGPVRAAARPQADVAGAQLPVQRGMSPHERTESVAVAPSRRDRDEDENPFAATPNTPVEEGIDAPAAASAVSPRVFQIAAAAAAASFLLFLGVLAFGVVRMLGASEPVVVRLVPVGLATAAVTVTVDGAERATALPARLEIPPGEHVLEVTGANVVPVKRRLVVEGPVEEPVFLVARAASPDAPSDPPSDAPETPPGDDEPAKPEDKPVAAVANDRGTPPPITGEGWRLSLAAVADDTGRPVDGAVVLIDNVAWGRTPFEAEIDAKRDSLEVRVRKDGYATRVVDVKRQGRAAVGPATVRLLPASSGAADTPPADAPAGDPSKVGGVDPAGDSPEVGEPAEAKAEPKSAPKTEPKAEPKSEPKSETKVAAKTEPKTEPKSEVKSEPKSEPKSTVKPEPKAEPKPEGKSNAKAMAELQLGTQPYAETQIDGRTYGSTPFMGPRRLSLSVGRHTVVFKDKQNNKKYRYSIEILGADPDNKVLIIFDKGELKTTGKVKVKRLD